jgi:hypothetical protein
MERLRGDDGGRRLAELAASGLAVIVSCGA